MTNRQTTTPATIRRESAQRTEGARSSAQATLTALRTPMVRGEQARRASVLDILNREGLTDTTPTESGVTLTARQVEVLTLVAEGMSYTQGAEAMHLSRATFKNHVANILRAYEVHTSSEAILCAVRDGNLVIL